MTTKKTNTQKKLLYIAGSVLVVLVIGVLAFQRLVLPKLINSTVNLSVDAAMEKLTSTDFSTAKVLPFTYLITNEGPAIVINANSGILTVDTDNSPDTVSGELQYFTTAPTIDVRSQLDAETKTEGTIIAITSKNEEPDNLTLHIPSDKSSGFVINMGAGLVNLNLTNTLTEYLNANIGAGKIDVTFSGKTSVEAHLTTGTGSIDMNIPTNIGKNIMFTQGIPANLDLGSNFVKTENGFKSKDYETAEYKADITITQGVGGFTLNGIE